MVNLLDFQGLNSNSMNGNDSGNFKNKLLENLNLSDGKEDIVFISLEDLPDDAKKKFEGYSKSFINPEDYKEGNFEKIGYIQHTFPESYITYFATQDKIYEDESLDNGSTEKLIYLFEKNEKGEKIGHGEIRLCIQQQHDDQEAFEDFFTDKPFVGFTQTEDNFLKKGYGLLRLIHMNQLVIKQFGFKLFSSDLFVQGTGAERNREKLVEYGLAMQSVDNDGKSRFSFV